MLFMLFLAKVLSYTYQYYIESLADSTKQVKVNNEKLLSIL